LKHLPKTLLVSFFIFCTLIFTYIIVLSLLKTDDVHNFEGKCNDCHINIPKGNKGETHIFIKSITQICLDCHNLSNIISHPVDIIPSMIVPEDLHLDWEGRITCATCHDIHQKKRKSLFGKGYYFLRRVETGRAFCESCHYKIEEAHKAFLDIAHVGFKYREVKEVNDETEVDRTTAECLRCHDYSISRHERTRIAEGIWDHGPAGISHPIGVKYPDPKNPLSRKEFVMVTELPPQIKLTDGKINCISCHDPYSEEKGQLVIENKEGALCLACHIK
jgi:predicted CXXCH cytochrome family protein